MNNNFGYLSKKLPIDNGIINIIKIIDGIILSYKIDIDRRIFLFREEKVFFVLDFKYQNVLFGEDFHDISVRNIKAFFEYFFSKKVFLDYYPYLGEGFQEYEGEIPTLFRKRDNEIRIKLSPETRENYPFCNFRFRLNDILEIININDNYTDFAIRYRHLSDPELTNKLQEFFDIKYD